MNRDAILATLIGLALGLTITGFLVIGPGLTKYLPKVKLPAIAFSLFSSKPEVKSNSAENKPKPVTFSVTSPLPEAIVTDGGLVVSGSALPNSIVVVSGITDDEVVAVGADAKFAGKVTLSEGKNDIYVTQYLDAKPTTIKVTVYFTEESI